MRIAINTIPLLSPLTGVGSYIYHIAHSLRNIDSINEYTYFYGYYSRDLHAYYNEDKKIGDCKSFDTKLVWCHGHKIIPTPCKD